jgi:hypothetical protein
MPLNPDYVIAPSLEMYFVDKDTGLPLTNGQVYFYQDNARTIPKDVFELSGAPPNYSYTVLPNPVILSAVGTFSDDSGNDIIPYYYPYDQNGNVQLYYIEVYDMNGVLQFTRQGWPNTVSENVNPGDEDVTNFIPNGQFLLHDNIPATSSNMYMAGELSQDVTVIAPGGWTFERGPMSTATDFVTFPAFPTYIETPTGNPKFGCKTQCTIAGSDTRKDLCIKWPGVNTFASTTAAYNFYFEGASLTGGNVTVEVYISKFFGTGGSPSSQVFTLVTSFTLTPAYGQFNVPIIFGSNAGYSLGTNGDDYVQICLRFPPTSIYSAETTDFALTIGDEVLTSFPTQTEAQQIAPSTAGQLPVPDPNGFSLYLPTVLAPTGLIFDNSSIGEIVGLMNVSVNPPGNLLFCNGTQYLTAGYSSLGIPYKRLQQVLFNSTINGPIFGTGFNFVNTYINGGTTAQFYLTTNKAGSQTNPADGSTATSFTFNASVNTGTSTIHFNANANGYSKVIAISTILGDVALGVSAGTSGMTVGDLHQSGNTVTAPYYSFYVDAIAASSLAAGSGMAGLYFDFSNTTTRFRMWFYVNGEVAPANGGNTLIECNLDPNMTAFNVSSIIANVINGCQTNTIQVTGLPTAGSFFTFNANSTQYTVWYKVNGAGTAPVVTAPQLIEVDLAGTETDAQVASITQTAINSQYFQVPDLRGYFLRGADTTGNVDTDVSYRYSNFSNNTIVGSYEEDMLIMHTHSIADNATGGSTGAGGGSGSTFVGVEGGSETRPWNVAVNYFIRY